MIEIRQAYPTDAYILVKIRDLAWKNNYYDVLSNKIISDKNKHVEDSVKHLQDQIMENNRILVAVFDNEIVGFVFYAKTQGDHYDNAEIREIYVLPEYQGRGIGRRLFEEAVSRLSQLRYHSFIVSCPLQNRSINFFFHMGGVSRGHKKEEIFQNSFDCEVIYFDISGEADNSLKQNDWNQLYLMAQDQFIKLNDIHHEIAVLLSESGNYYFGLGFKYKVCPIKSAVSNMYLAGDKKVVKILILNRNGHLVLPCGECRDFLIYLGQDDAEILFDLGTLKTMTMKELNPYYKDAEGV